MTHNKTATALKAQADSLWPLIFSLFAEIVCLAFGFTLLGSIDYSTRFAHPIRYASACLVSFCVVYFILSCSFKATPGDTFKTATFALLLGFPMGIISRFDLGTTLASTVSPSGSFTSTPGSLTYPVVLLALVEASVEEILKSLSYFRLCPRPSESAIKGLSTGLGFQLAQSFSKFSTTPFKGWPFVLIYSFTPYQAVYNAASAVLVSSGMRKAAQVGKRRWAFIGVILALIWSIACSWIIRILIIYSDRPGFPWVSFFSGLTVMLPQLLLVGKKILH